MTKHWLLIPATGKTRGTPALPSGEASTLAWASDDTFRKSVMRDAPARARL